MLIKPLWYNEILSFFVISNINHNSKHSKWHSKLSRNTNLCKTNVERLSISWHQFVDTELLYLCANFRLRWKQIDEHCWFNMITQNSYFCFCQTFQLNKRVRNDVHQNWPITNEQLESQLNSRGCKHGGPLLEVVVGLICQWIQAHGRSGMNKHYREKYWGHLLYLNSKRKKA